MENVTKIKLNALEDVKEFVTEASKCDFEIDVFYNRFIVDAKSFLGVISMDLTRALSVSCQGYNPRFNNTLKKYAIA